MPLKNDTMTTKWSLIFLDHALERFNTLQCEQYILCFNFPF